MNRTTRATTAAFAAAIALGISSPAALAGPPDGHGDHPSHSHGPATSPGDRKFQAEQRNALREIARLDASIARALADSRLGKLAPINDVDVAAAVLANADADRAELADLATTVGAATPDFDFKALRADLHGVRPENYRIVVNVLRHAGGIDAQADALGGVADVDAAIDEAVADAVAITARSSKDEFKPVFAALEAAEAALEAAQTPTVVDTDGDGLSDDDEATLGTDPAVADTDGGGVSDGDEVADGTDPLDPTDDLV